MIRLVTLLLLICPPLLVQVSHDDNSFNVFVIQLIKITEDRDIKGLTEILHDTIFESNDICGYPGCLKEEFLEFHFRDGVGNDDWQMLSEIIKLGFTEVDTASAIVRFNGVTKVYEAPAYRRKIDNRRELVIVDKPAEVKEGPDINAKTIATVDTGTFACNCCIYFQNDDGVQQDKKGNYWIKIELKENQTGFVEFEKTSQQICEILEIGLINNEWKIISWYCGECG